ncbi:MAG TPA: hypothetical protein VE732_07715, partial [Nitrososphaera sp.]|nr:hypothetical protein [Nitrososphaera sp.]
TVATPFNFRQRPFPYIFRILAISRILLPIAIVSISVISPIISKFIKTHLSRYKAEIQEDT